MKMTGKTPRAVPSQIAMQAANRFSKFKKEEERAIRAADIRECEPVKKLIASWNTLPYDIKMDGDDTYSQILAVVSSIKAGASDVSEFLKYLRVYQENDVYLEDEDNGFQRKAGVFLSAVMNSGSDSDYDLWLHGLLPPYHIGFSNCKNLVIHGDVGDDTGTYNEGRIEVIGNSGMATAEFQKAGEFILWGDSEEDAGNTMEGGSLTIYGDAGYGLGIEMRGGIIHARSNAHMPIGESMFGGDIIIDGLAELNESSTPVGYQMTGGRIFLRGGVGKQFASIGERMQGGEIHVFGKMGLIDRDAKGKIFHDGKLVHPGEGK